jgi:hypothetical protein
LELALSQEVYEYLEELDEMNWSARGNVLNQYLRNTSIGTTVNFLIFISLSFVHKTLCSYPIINSKQLELSNLKGFTFFETHCRCI